MTEAILKGISCFCRANLRTTRVTAASLSRACNSLQRVMRDIVFSDGHIRPVRSALLDHQTDEETEVQGSESNVPKTHRESVFGGIELSLLITPE